MVERAGTFSNERFEANEFDIWAGYEFWSQQVEAEFELSPCITNETRTGTDGHALSGESGHPNYQWEATSNDLPF